jgi:hypothetical protein
MTSLVSVIPEVPEWPLSKNQYEEPSNLPKHRLTLSCIEVAAFRLPLKSRRGNCKILYSEAEFRMAYLSRYAANLRAVALSNPCRTIGITDVNLAQNVGGQAAVLRARLRLHQRPRVAAASSAELNEHCASSIIFVRCRQTSRLIANHPKFCHASSRFIEQLRDSSRNLEFPEDLPGSSTTRGVLQTFSDVPRRKFEIRAAA